jgi:site-specific recombinase XerD
MQHVAIELVPTAPSFAISAVAELADGARCPVRVYLAGLRSSNSRATMRDALRLVLRVATGTDAAPEAFPWASLTFAHVAAIRAGLLESESSYSPATVNKAMAAVRGVARAAWRLGLIDSDTFARISDVKGVRNDRLPPGRALEVAELRRLREACDGSPVGVRDAAILAVLFDGGLRRSELASIDVDDWNPETGELKIRHGKGDKGRIVFLRNGAQSALAAWIAVRPLFDGVEGAPLFWSSRNGHLLPKRLGSPAIASLLGRIAARAKVAKFAPHDCRRTAISRLLEHGCDLATAQRFAGHASSVTTARYDRRGDRALERAAALLHFPF